MMKLSSSTRWLLRWALLLVAAILIVLGVFTIPANAATGGGLTLLGSLVVCLMVWILRKGPRQRKTNNRWIISLMALLIAVGGLSLMLVGGVDTLNVSPEKEETPVPPTTTPVPPTTTPVAESPKSTPTAGRSLPSTTESVAPTTSSNHSTVETATITATYSGPTVEVYLTETITNFSTIYIPNPPASIPDPSEPVSSSANSPSEDPFNAPPQQTDQMRTEDPTPPRSN